MRRIVFDIEAARELADQIDYLIAQDALRAARTLDNRVRLFLQRHLARFPASGRSIKHRNLREIPIPRTRLVIWYRFTDDELQTVHIWHSSQDRLSR